MKSLWNKSLSVFLLAMALAACGDDSPGNSNTNNCDACGVCDDDPSNDCKQDCANTWVGEAVLDECGVCDADPSNDCVQDCAGEWGGSALEDECGVCDADTTNDCQADCAGTYGGDAVADMCGTCDNDPSNDCVQDCAGTYGGDAVVDMCETCDADATNDCVQDCTGAWGGPAMVDNCGTCDADASNDCPADCAGVFGGDALADMCGTCDNDPSNDCVQDCAGTYGGMATVDTCGTCDADATNDCVQDCNGTWGGPASLDMCGTCDTDATNDCVQDCNGVWGGDGLADMCGTCDTDATNDCVQDCNGDWGGLAVLDACGVCTGGNAGPSACITVTLPVVADAWVDAGAVNSNHGTDGMLAVTPPWYNAQQEDQIYLRFDLSGLPANAAVAGAKLRVMAYDGFAYGGDGNVYTHFVSDDTWQESTLTWANKPAAETANLGYWWLWYNGTDRNEWGVNASDALATKVHEEFAFGNQQISFMLRSPGYQTQYRSREHGVAAERPVLEVSYLPATTVAIGPEADAQLDTVAVGASTVLRLSSEIYSGNKPLLMRFNLASLPANARITSARLEMTAMSGYAYGNDGNVYTHLVNDDSWDEMSVTFATKPAHEATALGFWWLWYDINMIQDSVGSFQTEALTQTVQAEADGDNKISFLLRSPGYDTNYYAREHVNAANRPRLHVTYVQ